jgi:hypothetical protein
MEIIAELMRVPNGKVNGDWGIMYTELMKEAVNYKMTSQGEALKPLATVCYAQLKGLLKTEAFGSHHSFLKG